MVALVEYEDLGLVFEAAERRGMDDPVAIAPEIVPERARRLRIGTSAARAWIRRIGGSGPTRLDSHGASPAGN